VTRSGRRFTAKARAVELLKLSASVAMDQIHSVRNSSAAARQPLWSQVIQQWKTVERTSLHRILKIQLDPRFRFPCSANSFQNTM
jgi:hypothetical protein